MRTFNTPEEYRAKTDPFEKRWRVATIWAPDLHVFYSAQMPRSLLPTHGERLALYLGVSNVTVETSFTADAKRTSSFTLVIENTDNAFGRLLYRTKLLRRAAVFIVDVFESLNDWDQRETIAQGYVSGIELGDPKCRIFVRS